MSQIRIDSEDITEIRNALEIIQGKIELIITEGSISNKGAGMIDIIFDQVQGINKLLPGRA